MQNEFQTIKFTVENCLGTITINRPDRLNALNRLVLSELSTLLDHIKQNFNHQNLHGIMITGEGEKAFIAGADIKEMSNMGLQDAINFGQLGQRVSLQMESLPFVVIGLVNGFALGGGLEMALATDFIFATENASFGAPEVKLGLIPGFGGTQRLAKIVGRNKARELVYSGRTMSAAEAQEMGLVLKVFESKSSMVKAALDWFQVANKNSRFAIGKAKKVMNLANDFTVEDGLKAELTEFSGIFNTDDMKEGTRAFLEKRPSNFQGK